MPQFTQENRQLQIETPLGKDALLLRSFSGHEDVSRLFSFTLDLYSEKDGISAKDIVGKEVTFSVLQLDEKPRYFHGHVSRFAYLGTNDRISYYRAEVVPWLWFLTKTADCRIFQEMTVTQIVEQIFSDLGFTNFEFECGSYPTWEYCVQYRETDFAFVSRLLEESGIFYFFRHENGKHTLVLGDKNSAFKDLPENEVSAPLTEGFAEAYDGITRWEHGYSFRSGKFSLTDFDFKKPGSSLVTHQPSVAPFAIADKLEVYDYPGEYEVRDVGSALTRVRMEEEEIEHDVVSGTSTYRTFSTGGKFKITQHASKAEIGKSYVLTSVRHSATSGESYLSGGEAAGILYENSFRCVPVEFPFRPARTTPRPIVQGVQTAIVTGPAGEEIFTDKFGRVKVQFHWDREGKNDDKSSCWIRVSSTWAGKGWGQISIPRIGQEVIVDFLEGNPDRPIITGRVYNAEQTVPYSLPAEMTKSCIKTRSSKGGDPSNFNEIRFEDKKGEEELYFHAEKDQTIVVENDRNEAVGNDRTLNVGRDKSEEVGRNKEIKVGDNHTEQIGSAMSLTVGKTLTELVGLNHSETVGGAMEITVGGAMAITVGAALAETVGGMKAESVGLQRSVNVGGNNALNVGKSLNETVGKDRVVKVAKDLTETVGGQHKESVEKEFIVNAKKIQLVAKDEIQIKVGSAEIILKKNGDISIKGKKIDVKGSGDVTIKGSQIKEN